MTILTICIYQCYHYHYQVLLSLLLISAIINIIHNKDGMIYYHQYNDKGVDIMQEVVSFQ